MKYNFYVDIWLMTWQFQKHSDSFASFLCLTYLFPQSGNSFNSGTPLNNWNNDWLPCLSIKKISSTEFAYTNDASWHGANWGKKILVLCFPNSLQQEL